MATNNRLLKPPLKQPPLLDCHWVTGLESKQLFGLWVFRMEPGLAAAKIV